MDDALPTSRRTPLQQAVVTNDTSAFSITTLARHGHLLNGPLPTAAAAAAAVSSTKEGHFKFDISKSSEASSLEEASYDLSTMLSTALPWERDEPLNDGADDAIDSTQKLEPTQLSPSTIVESSVPPLLHHMQPTTLATSKFGPDYVTKRLVPYMQHLRLHRNRQLTFIEYASLLGRHHISQMLLLGGLDPLTTSIGNNGNDHSVDKKGERPAELASRRVLALFHSLGNPEETSKGGGDNGTSSCMIPLSIWNYMIRAVIEMRMNGVLDADKGERVDRHEGRAECSLCDHEAHLLQFGPPCRHTYCEPCMWNHLVDQVPLCTDLTRNVVTCPICAEEFGGFQCCGAQRGSRQKNDATSEQKVQMSKVSTEISEEKKDAEDTLSMNDLSLRDVQQEESSTPSVELREQRRLQSLAKYMKLPATSAELKSIKRNKRKKHRDSAHGTWGEAIRPMIQTQQSKEVRFDRFFRSVPSSPHLVIGYLDAGYDVNIQNEYGQTPLYLACWKGSVMVVQCLLDYGADVSIAANGGSSCYSVAKKYDREDVLRLLERYAGAIDDSADSTWAINRPLALTSDDDNYQVSILIDPTADHPGAGACIVDNALSEDQLQQLEKLWQSLLVADTCDDGNEKNSPNKNAKSLKSGVAMEGEQPSGLLSHDTSYTSEKSTYRPSRTYFCDAEEKIRTMLEGCVQAARMALASYKNCNESSSANNPTNNAKPPSSLFQHIRFLNYEEPGGILPPHVDLCRVDDASGCRSTHTFILYLTDCPVGGGTALLKELKDPKVLAVTQPKRGRALIFRHLCPHSGLEVDSAPKLLLRGEVILDLP